VDLLNKNVGIYADILSAGRYPSIYKEAVNILDLSIPVIAQKIEVFDKKLKSGRIDTAYFPLFTVNKERGDSLTQILGLLIANLKTFPKEMQVTIEKASSFRQSSS
jgi:hypothetical protein